MFALVWIFLLILIFIIVLPVRVPSLRTMWYIQKIHGPPGIPPLGVALLVALLKPDEYFDYVKGLFDKYPRAFAVWLLGMPFVALEEPEDIEVAFGNMTYITKGIEYSSLRPWLQEGLLTSTGNKWHTRRKILTPSFHFQILDDSLQSMNRNAIIFTKKLLEVKEQPIDIDNFSRMCTLDVICESVMGVTIGAQVDQGKEYTNSIKRICELIILRDTSFWLHRNLMFYLSPIGFEFRKILKFLHNFSDKVISERKKSFFPSKQQGTNRNRKIRRAFLDTLIEYEAENPNSLSKYDIREEVDTFMFEGHDTTASALSFTLLLLGHHQNVQDKVIDELYDIFGKSDRSVEMKDLSRMTYLEKVIKESLRIFPSVPYISRTLTADLNLKDGKTVVPAGTNLIVLPYLIHRNPRYFPDSEQFDPERFSEEKSQNMHPYAYIPFSAGPRNCIGQKFAMMEMKIVLSTLLRAARVESITKIEDIRPTIQLILRSTVPVKIKIMPRKIS